LREGCVVCVIDVEFYENFDVVFCCIFGDVNAAVVVVVLFDDSFDVVVVVVVLCVSLRKKISFLVKGIRFRYVLFLYLRRIFI